jgi:hypothetical protein
MNDSAPKLARAIISCGASLILASVWFGVVCAREASRDDRARMAVSIANCIHDEPNCARSFDGATAIEIGTAAIEGNVAIADWHEGRGSRYGQVGFFYLCDHWNVGPVSNGVPLRPAQLLMNPPWGPTKATASKLVAELAQLETQHVGYITPAKPGPDC